MRSYITYAMTLLQEKGSSEIVFKAMGRAINKTVTIVELIKRRIVGLHQNTSIGSTDITDTWEPLEEGLLPMLFILFQLETTRHVSMITITLSKEELNTSSIGYQPPLPADQVKVSTEFEYEGEGSPTARGRGRGGRGRGRGRSRPAPGNGYAQEEYDDGGWDGPGGYPRGRGRGRAAASVAVEGEITTTPHTWMVSKIPEDTIKNLLGAGVVISVVVEGEVTTMDLTWIISKTLGVTTKNLPGVGVVISVVVEGVVIITNRIWILNKMPEVTIKNFLCKGEGVVVGGELVEGVVVGSDRTGQTRRQKATSEVFSWWFEVFFMNVWLQHLSMFCLIFSV
ncbi:putative DNA/RNA-binding protein Alba [Helianthus annuus]|nr:putative DNA/RNA-binding protein Alba [Helianthus annuus]